MEKNLMWLTWQANCGMFLQPQNMKIPLQGHFGRHDTFFPVKVISAQISLLAWFCYPALCSLESTLQADDLNHGKKL